MELTDDNLRTLYYENLFGAANPKRLLQEVKQNGYKAPTLKYVTDFIKNQATAQQFRRVNPRRLFVPIVGKEYHYQADLMFFDRGSQKVPILVMIELTSRKAYGRIMPNKKASTTATALESKMECIYHGLVQTQTHSCARAPPHCCAGAEFRMSTGIEELDRRVPQSQVKVHRFDRGLIILVTRLSQYIQRLGGIIASSTSDVKKCLRQGPSK